MEEVYLKRDLMPYLPGSVVLLFSLTSKIVGIGGASGGEETGVGGSVGGFVSSSSKTSRSGDREREV